MAADPLEAYKWRILAAGQGNTEAQEGLRALEKNLTPAQMTEGERRANNFRPGPEPSPERR